MSPRSFWSVRNSIAMFRLVFHTEREPPPESSLRFPVKLHNLSALPSRQFALMHSGVKWFLQPQEKKELDPGRLDTAQAGELTASEKVNTVAPRPSLPE